MQLSSRRVVLIHAYRRSNAGDGLLVDAAAELVKEAIPDADLTLISLDPSSFPEFPQGLHPVGGRAAGLTIGGLLRAVMLRRPSPELDRLVAEADVVVAVGGGYLRMGGFVEAAKTSLAHVTQMPRRSTPTPFIYLPQSIGPFPRLMPTGMKRLRNAATVFVRDDRSYEELDAIGVSTQRAPDLAVLRIAHEQAAPSEPSGNPVGLIARELRGRRAEYVGRLRALSDHLKPELLVQSHGSGNDDPEFYRRMGWAGEYRAASEAVQSSTRPDAVVSVRLHGALQSILAGVPAIHLSYERKGWGAFEDLGLGPFVHNAWRFDPDRVAEQARAIIDDPSDYWSAVRRSIPLIKDSRERVVDAIRVAARSS